MKIDLSFNFVAAAYGTLTSKGQSINALQKDMEIIKKAVVK